MPRIQQASSRRIRLGGLVTVLFFLVLVARFWHPVYGFTAFFQLDASNDDLKLPAFRELPVYVYRDTGGYDGLYYAQIALDPSLRDPALPRAMDNYSYRARRILPPALAWVFGFGRSSCVIAAYSLINVVAWIALAALLWRVLEVRDVRGWVSWAGVLFSSGALCSVRLSLTDLVAALLIVAGIAAAERCRKFTALGCVATAALARETSLLALAGLVKPPWFSLKNAARIPIALTPLATWMLYVRWRVGPADRGFGNLTWPIVGFVEKWRATLTLSGTDNPWLASTTFLALLALSVQAGFVLGRPNLKSRWWRVGVAYVLLMLCLGTAVWEGHPGAATRVLLPLTLAFNVLAQRSRASMIWLIAGNLGVFAGLLTLRDVPMDSTEFATVRRGDIACITHVGEGWFGPEETARHHWMWARQHGLISVEAWPKNGAVVQFSFSMRSLAPRTVVLRQDGHEIWRANIGTARSSHFVEVRINQGHTTLEFFTDSAPVRENATATARELAFALYDLRLTVPKQ